MSEALNSLQAKARTEAREAGLNLLESKMAEMVVTKFLQAKPRTEWAMNKIHSRGRGA